MNKWNIRALVELQYEVDYGNCLYDSHRIELSEAGEIEIQLEKDIPLYQDFEANVKKIKATKVR